MAFALFALLPVNVFASEEFTKYEIMVDDPVVGETPCETAKVVFKSEDKSYEFVMKVRWNEYNDDYPGAVASTFEVGKKYVFGFLLVEDTFISGSMEDYEELEDKYDFRTRALINGKEISSEDDVIYGPLEDNVRVTLTLTNITSSNTVSEIARGSEYKTILTADTGYNLPETIIVKVGGNVLDSTKYTYDSDTGTLTIPSQYVTGSIKIETPSSNSGIPATSQPEEENPETFDSITNSILMGTISLIGLISATIYLKRRNKVRV